MISRRSHLSASRATDHLQHHPFRQLLASLSMAWWAIPISAVAADLLACTWIMWPARSHASNSAPSCRTDRPGKRQLPGKGIWPSSARPFVRTLNEPHEPLLTIDDDFASPPAVFEPVVACSLRARGQARRRTSTSCGLHENRRDRHFKIYPSNMAMGIRDIEPDFLGRVPPTIRLPPNDIDVGSVARVVDCLVALVAPAHEDRHLTTMELVRSGSPLVGRAMKSNGSWAVVSAIISCRLPGMAGSDFWWLGSGDCLPSMGRCPNTTEEPVCRLHQEF